MPRYAEAKLKIVEHGPGAFNQPRGTGRPIVLEELDSTNSTFDQPDGFV